MLRLVCSAAILVSASLFVAYGQPRLAPPDAPVWKTESTERVSVSSDGDEGNGDSGFPTVSQDGRYVAYHSYASTLVHDDMNGCWDVFVHDRLTGETVRISVSPDGDEGNGHSGLGYVSADGRWVVFDSRASNLVEGDENGNEDVFVCDRKSMQMRLVSVSSDGEQGNSYSYAASISADGRYVDFVSHASNFTSGHDNDRDDVFVHDCVTGETWCVSVSSEGELGNGGSDYSSISADGRYVVFMSTASNLVLDDANDTRDVFVHDCLTGKTERVSVSAEGEEGDGPAGFPSISADGRYIAFHTLASNLVEGDTNEASDVFVHDRVTGGIELVSVSSEGHQGNDRSYTPFITRNGRYVAFSSYASNLVADDTNGVRDVFMHDRETGETVRVSVSAEGEEGNWHSGRESLDISDDGSVAFSSAASNLVPGDGNRAEDIFVHEFLPGRFTWQRHGGATSD